MAKTIQASIADDEAGPAARARALLASYRVPSRRLNVAMPGRTSITKVGVASSKASRIRPGGSNNAQRAYSKLTSREDDESERRADELARLYGTLAGDDDNVSEVSTMSARSGGSATRDRRNAGDVHNRAKNSSAAVNADLQRAARKLEAQHGASLAREGAQVAVGSIANSASPSRGTRKQQALTAPNAGEPGSAGAVKPTLLGTAMERQDDERHDDERTHRGGGANREGSGSPAIPPPPKPLSPCAAAVSLTSSLASAASPPQLARTALAAESLRDGGNILDQIELPTTAIAASVPSRWRERDEKFNSLDESLAVDLEDGQSLSFVLDSCAFPKSRAGLPGEQDSRQQDRSRARGRSRSSSASRQQDMSAPRAPARRGSSGSRNASAPRPSSADSRRRT